MKKRKKDFPVKYLRKGLFTDEELKKEETKKKGKRHIKKHKFSVHVKTRATGRKIK